MRVTIRDRDALLAVSPTALTAYARAAGWRRQEPYRDCSDVYVGEERPEIIIPRTERLGDYASVVGRLIEIFGRVTGQDELAVYRSLVTADRDVVRVRAGESHDGSVPLSAGVVLVIGARDMMVSVACALGKPRPVYREDANEDATALVDRMRLGQTEEDGFVVTLLTSVVPPTPESDSGAEDRDAPIGRRLTRRLVEALTATRQTVEHATVGDDNAFGDAVVGGVSANLCEALVRLIGPFPTLEVGVAWARTWPVEGPVTPVRFGQSDAAFLRAAATALRAERPEAGRA